MDIVQPETGLANFCLTRAPAAIIVPMFATVTANRSEDRSVERLGRTPEPWNQLKLELRWIVFQDRHGNLVVVDPDRPRPMGLEQEKDRPPTIYFAATDAELDSALEEMLFHYRHATTPTSKRLELVESVVEARRRFYGISRKEQRAA